jgi:hypothetical protein
LTPRRVSLINIFTIALPSFFIALRNNNVGKVLNFAGRRAMDIDGNNLHANLALEKPRGVGVVERDQQRVI